MTTVITSGALYMKVNERKDKPSGMSYRATTGDFTSEKKWRKYNNAFNNLGNDFGARVTRSGMADRLTTVFPAVPGLFTHCVASYCHGRRALRRLFSLSAHAGLCRKSLTRRTRTRMTENVAVMWTVVVTLPTTNLSTAVWSDVLVKLGVFQFTCMTTNQHRPFNEPTFSRKSVNYVRFSFR